MINNESKKRIAFEAQMPIVAMSESDGLFFDDEVGIYYSDNPSTKTLANELNQIYWLWSAAWDSAILSTKIDKSIINRIMS